MDVYGGVEAGGTKFNCVVGTGPDDIRADARFPTTAPQETLKRVIDFFREYQQSSGNSIRAIGIASFGPVDLDESSPTYGYITTTPKAGWPMTNMVGPIRDAFQVPVAFDHDVIAPGIAKSIWGVARGLNDFMYMTIGTGIGGGAIVHGKPLHGLVHSEMGHIRMPHNWDADPYPGCCPFHGDCLEGMASGPAMMQRWGQRAETLPLDHPAWNLEADYIALAMQTFICTLSPQRIILGGGVMQQGQLFPLVRHKVQQYLNGYVRSPALLEGIDAYIVSPALGNRVGVLGSLALAMRAVGKL